MLPILASYAQTIKLVESIGFPLETGAEATSSRPHFVDEILGVSWRAFVISFVWLDHFNINEWLLLPAIDED